MSEKTMFESAMSKTKKAFDLLADANNEFKALGLNANNFSWAWWYETNAKVLLNNGITRLSTVSETPIQSDTPHMDYGSVEVDGIQFCQPKLPVEREDRYA